MRSMPYNALRSYPMNKSSFPDNSATNSSTPEGYKAWLAREGNPNQVSGVENTRQPSRSPTAVQVLQRKHEIIRK